jgi:regulator of sigma E protease
MLSCYNQSIVLDNIKSEGNFVNMNFSFLAIVFVFGLLVVIHELGHFLAAKWMGVRVERFSIGFPPRLFGKKIGDTDYCISAIPLGGYVKLSGMIDESMDGELTGADHEFSSKPVWKRIIIITAGVVMNFILAILILTIVSFSKGEVVYPSTEIGEIGERGIAERIGFQIGDKITAIEGVDINTWNDIQIQFIKHLNDDITFDVLRGDEKITLLYKQEWFSEKNAEVLDIGWVPLAKVGEVKSDSPAERAGFQWGDEIRRINGFTVQNWTEMTRIIKENPGNNITIDYIREGKFNSVDIIPETFSEKDSEGNEISVGRIGIYFYYETYDISLFKAVENGFTNTFALIGLNMRGLWWVITGTKSASDVIGGPIMIAKLAQDAAEVGWDRLWNLIAALSAILAFFNILPIPALDGGHLVFLILEGVLGKPISTRTKLVVQQIGMAILLTLIVLIVYIDIRRLLF